MPWRRTDVLEERVRFVLAYLEGEGSVAELCRVFGVSRKTAYKFLGRYRVERVDGLRDRSRAPHTHPNALTAGTTELLLRTRLAHPTWGARKLLAYLVRRYPGLPLPAASTVIEHLKRRGLSHPPHRRRHIVPFAGPFATARRPNDVWCADFKGWFRAQNGEPCEPLTISDAMSRFALRCQLLEETTTPVVQAAFVQAFREYGLPAAIRTDNGPPFASRALFGLSRLAVWWIKLGISVERIAPGKPQQNGRHERFHLTLQQHVARPPAPTRAAQQQACDRFLREYNHERPHAALGNRTPADVYTPSPRTYPRRLAPCAYPAAFEVRTVQLDGHFTWRAHDVYVTKALGGERLGFERVSDEHWTVHFGPLELGLLDDRHLELLPHAAPKVHTTWANPR